MEEINRVQANSELRGCDQPGPWYEHVCDLINFRVFFPVFRRQPVLLIVSQDVPDDRSVDSRNLSDLDDDEEEVAREGSDDDGEDLVDNAEA